MRHHTPVQSLRLVQAAQGEFFLRINQVLDEFLFAMMLIFMLQVLSGSELLKHAD